MPKTDLEAQGFAIRRVHGAGRFDAPPLSAFGIWQQVSGGGHLECPVAGTVPLKPGTIVLHDCALGASGDLTLKAKALEIEFTRHFLNDVALLEFGIQPPATLRGGARPLEDENLSRMVSLLTTLADGIGPASAEDAETRLARVSVGSLARAVATHLLAQHVLPRETISVDARLARVMAFIEVHLEETIRLEDMAREAGYSPFHFSRVFTQQTGETPQLFVRGQRVRRACHLLRNTEISLSEIAYTCGFASQAHFNVVFKKHTGRTPGQFRKAARSMSDETKGPEDLNDIMEDREPGEDVPGP